MSDSQPTVTDNTALSRYEITVDGELAGYSEYVDHPDRRVVTHTVTLPEFEGRGVGTALLRGVLDDIRSRGIRVVPSCPFLRAFLERHKGEYDDVYPGR